MKVTMKWGMLKGEPATVVDTQIRGIPVVGGQNPVTWKVYKIKYDNPEYGESGWLSEKDITII